MPATLKWNRLLITAATDVEFADCFATELKTLLALTYDELECDLTAVKELGAKSKKALSAACVVMSSNAQRLTLRIPDHLESGFRACGALDTGCKIEVIKHLPAHAALKGDGERTERPVISSTDSLVYKPVEPRTRKPNTTSSLGGPQAPLPSGKGSLNRRTVVGLPLDIFENDADPSTRKDADGVEELIMTSDAAGSSSDLSDVLSDVSSRKLNDAPELAQAWLVAESDGAVREISNEVIIGRDPPADWVIAAPTISKRHCRIYRDRKRFWIQDLNATNGTFVNGTRISSAPALLLDGDRVTIAITSKHPEGAVTLTFRSNKPE